MLLGGLCYHATSRLMAALFEMHDRKRFEVIGISFGLDDAARCAAGW